MTRIFIGVIAALMVALVISGMVLKHEITKTGELTTSYKVSQQDVKKLNEELARRNEVDKVTDSVVTQTNKENTGVEKTISDIQKTIRSTSKREAKGEITPATASSVYIDSMWRAYCQADIPNPRCASR